MFLETVVVFNFVFGAYAAATNDSYKDQFCTDPRTMKRHAAYTEWADAYSCTRHRCQPGGRNLAIYTVGCKRVEAPESAIECEEVVEDTNMQFPYCCTRLRCLVVVRGEVWTRVLGQPWETLPAAPWSHMYKMKRPPPSDDAFVTKSPETGPVYELVEPDTKPDRRDNSHKKPRGNTKPTQEALEPQSKRDELEDFENNAAPRETMAAPDIVIALATSNDLKGHKTPEKQQKSRHPQSSALLYDEEKPEEAPEENVAEVEDNTLAVPEKAHQQVAWNEITPNKWKGDVDTENLLQPLERTAPDTNSAEKKEEKPSTGNLQALVDAIGTRMRDIEHVVHKMSEKVHKAKKASDADGGEIRPQNDQQDETSESKAPGSSYAAEPYKRFSVKNRGSKYLRSYEPTTAHPGEDESGYFSDVSNSLVRRSSDVKDPEPIMSTYMAPVESRRKAGAPMEISGEELTKKKKKKHQHHKKHSKKGGKKKKKDNTKKFNSLGLNSVEMDRTEVSLEVTSAQN